MNPGSSKPHCSRVSLQLTGNWERNPLSLAVFFWTWDSGAVGKESASLVAQYLGGEGPRRGERLLPPVFLPGELRGQRGLAGHGPGVAKSWTRLSGWHTHRGKGRWETVWKREKQCRDLFPNLNLTFSYLVFCLFIFLIIKLKKFVIKICIKNLTL